MNDLSTFSLRPIALYLVSFCLLLPLSLHADSIESVPVTVAQITHEQRSQSIRNSGRISSKNETRLSFKTGGLIEQIIVEEGEEVFAGQILARLDLEEINAQQQRAASNFKKASADFERFSQLYEKSLVSEQVKQSAKSATDNARAELQIADFNKKLAVIRAPSAGRILKRFAESNEQIKAGQPVFLLASREQGSVVRLGLIDRDVVKVGVGDPASISLDAYPGRQFSGIVSEVAQSTVSEAGTFEIEIRIDDQGFVLRSGLIARVEIIPVSRDLQYFIPVESIVRAENGLATIFVFDGSSNSVNEVSVEIVEFLRDEVAVKGSLKASDRIIRLGAAYLSDGGKVSVVDES